MFVIWYLGFEFLRWIMPGVGSSDVVADGDPFDLAAFFKGLSGACSKVRGLSG